MGRRELILIAVFLGLGVIVYQVTAPATTSTSRVSLGDFFKGLRREMTGTKATAVADRAIAATVAPAITRLRIEGFTGRLTIAGTDGDHLAAQLKVQVGGDDQAEAQAAVAGLVTEWRLDQTEAVLVVRHPDEWRVQMRRVPGELSISAPRRLSIRLDVDGGTSEITDMAGVTLDAGRTNVTLTRIAGKIDGAMSDGSLRVTSAGGLDVETRRTTVTVDGVTASARFDSSEGQIDVSNVAGAIDLEVRRLRAVVRRPGSSVRAEARDVTLELDDLRGALTVDGARTTVKATVAALAAVTIETTDGAVIVNLPGGPVVVDAANETGPIDLPAPAPPGQRDGLTERRKAQYGQGGPQILLRNKNGPITVTRAS